ncbi:MAG: trimethylamine methyltransferase family protein, partial [Anaerolineales bacterium]
MQPKLELISQDLIDRILDEAFQLLMKPGIKVQSREARQLLLEAGARSGGDADVILIPEKVARQALQSVPHAFQVYNRLGEPVIHYGGEAVHFDPGSSGVHALDPETLEHKPAYTPDLVR